VERGICPIAELNVTS